MVRKEQVALHVRVKLNENYRLQSILDRHYLKNQEDGFVIYICDPKPITDLNITSVWIKSEGLIIHLVNTDELDLEFPIEQN
jgi:hypothetical protein